MAAALARLSLFTDVSPLRDVALTDRRVAARVAGVDVGLSGRPSSRALDLGDLRRVTADWRERRR